MKKTLKERILKTKIAADMVRRDQINDRLKFAAENSRKNVFAAPVSYTHLNPVQNIFSADKDSHKK